MAVSLFKKREEKHVCTHTKSLPGECLRCRNNRRWTEYKTNPFPIYGKGGRYTAKASKEAH